MVTHGDLSTVVARGDYRETLVAIRNALAALIDDPQRAQHRRDCTGCTCDFADDRNMVPLFKELRAVVGAIDDLPADKEATAVDDIVARASAKVVSMETKRRAGRTSGAPAS
jgi:hypothetical protein